MPNGRRTPAVHDSRMIANVASAIHGALHIWNAGRIEMNAIEMPASVPSIAARGVYRRIVGPMKAPIRTIDADEEGPREPGLPGLRSRRRSS